MELFPAAFIFCKTTRQTIQKSLIFEFDKPAYIRENFRMYAGLSGIFS
jgi:hypothetical protein